MPNVERFYRLYVDESGDHTFSKLDSDHHRYLGLLGVWFERGTHYRTFYQQIEALKERVFGHDPDEEPICLHRKDIVERRRVFSKLRDPRLNEIFEQELLSQVAEAKFRMCGVVLDKKLHSEKTYRELFHPYHYCMAALMERYAGWLELIGAKGDVMAEARGKEEDRLLSEAFGLTITQGTRFHSAERFQRVLTSRKLKLKKKEHNIAGLQLADLLAYPFRREMICEQQEEAPPKDFSARLLDACRERINKHELTKRATGYGKIFLT